MILISLAIICAIWGVSFIVIRDIGMGKKFRIITNGFREFAVQKRVLFIWTNIGTNIVIRNITGCSFVGLDTAEKALEEYLEKKNEHKQDKGRVIKSFEYLKGQQVELTNPNFDPLKSIKRKCENFI